MARLSNHSLLLVASASVHALALSHRLRDAPVIVGCYSSSKPLSNQGTYKYQSSGYCSGVCTSLNEGVVGLSNGNTCWCGSELPAANTKVLDSKCSTPCQGYGIEDCGGGTYYFTIWLTGLQDNVPTYNPNTTSSTTSTTSTTASPTSTSIATTAKHNPTSAPTASSSEASDDPDGLSDKAIAIIIGIVIGLAAFVILAVVLCCLWRRKRKTGTFVRRRPSTLLSITSRPSSWASVAPEAIISVMAGSRKWEGRISSTPRRSSQAVPAQDPRDGSMSDQNPFYTPQERQSSSYSRHNETSENRSQISDEMDHQTTEQRQIPASPLENREPPLPPALQAGGPERIDTLLWHQDDHSHSNNSSSPDNEAADVVSPMAPVKSIERIHSFPMVHYPSWSEVSDFDFTGAKDSTLERKPVGGWHPWRERRDGRYELA